LYINARYAETYFPITTIIVIPPSTKIYSL
jgi:hypothetical protein